MADPDNETLKSYVQAARRKLALLSRGPAHAMWDVVFDAEALIKDEPAIMDRASAFRALQAFVDDRS